MFFKQSKQKMDAQPNLFETDQRPEIEKILLYALGEFQSRGKVLAERELALDRLRGAFKRASEKFETSRIFRRKIAENLENSARASKKFRTSSPNIRFASRQRTL
jgi:hypothetical protein